jgi:hypothetical protein
MVSARMVVVASPDAVSVVVEEESAASEEAGAPPPISSPAAGVGAEVVELRSTPPPPPSSGAWAPAPDQGAVATLEPPEFRPLRMVLVPGLWHRHLLLTFPAGNRTSGSRLPGTFAGALLAVRCGARDLEPAVGVASQLPDHQAAFVQGRHRRQD